MYLEERENNRKKMHKTFGTYIATWCGRKGLFTIEAVKEYIEKYPYDKYSKIRCYYKGIGPVNYKLILEAINKEEES